MVSPPRHPWGPITLKTLELSPLGVRWSYRIDEATARAAEQAAEEMSQGRSGMAVQSADGSQMAMEVSITPDAPVTVVLKDGTEVSASGGFAGEEDGLQVCSSAFTAPVDLSQADHLLWGDTEIPLN